MASVNKAKFPYNRLSLVGKKFNRLTVISDAGKVNHPDGSSHSLWLCECECGNKKVVYGASLTSGNTKSCGCLSRQRVLERNSTHKLSRTRTHRIWQAMLNRCRNSKMSQYKNYGGRGITVDERWEKFENFLADMGEAPPNTSIDRKDNNGNYCKENCRWATRHQQSRNKSNNRVIEFNGVAKCLKDWASDLGINQSSLRERLDRWSLDKALTHQKKESRHGIS